jgi:hypothetical protein
MRSHTSVPFVIGNDFTCGSSPCQRCYRLPVGRDSHDYHSHSVLAFLLYRPSRLPFLCGENKAGSLLATKAL